MYFSSYTFYGLGKMTYHNSNAIDKNSSNMNRKLYKDEKYLFLAVSELKLNNVSEGLWAIASAHGNGDIEKAKSFYVKERAKQFKQAHREKLKKEITEQKMPPLLINHSVNSSNV